MLHGIGQFSVSKNTLSNTQKAKPAFGQIEITGEKTELERVQKQIQRKTRDLQTPGEETPRLATCLTGGALLIDYHASPARVRLETMIDDLKKEEAIAEKLAADNPGLTVKTPDLELTTVKGKPAPSHMDKLEKELEIAAARERAFFNNFL